MLEKNVILFLVLILPYCILLRAQDLKSYAVFNAGFDPAGGISLKTEYGKTYKFVCWTVRFFREFHTP